ncbi:MAG: DMT family transporter [Patescibacteria group bacterium]
MNLSWFPYSIAATIIFGIAMALYKLPAAKSHNRFATAFWSLLVPAILALLFFYPYLYLSTPAMIWTALIWGVTFTGIVLLQMYALSHVDTNVLFPITTTASLILTVLVGMLFFHEYPSLVQALGILLAIGVIFSFLSKGGRLQYSNMVIAVGTAIFTISAFNKVLQKIIAGQFDIHAFQIYQYGFAALFSLALYLFLHRKNWRKELFGGGLKAGSLIGVFSFLGGYSLYIALTKGPFPLITSIHSLYIIITALVAYLLFGEKLTKKKIFLLFIAVIAVVLIRVG